ncbi:MAG TPA: M3 family metallopeptidase, partial [Trueperaceae bacterium]|nr:M3 family metallopeptidase [Trueperaceae bacterium]
MSHGATTSGLPHWQLESIYPSLDSQQYLRDKERLQVAIDDLERYFTDNRVRADALASEPVLEAASGSKAVILEGALDRLEECSSLMATLQPFVNLRIATDAFDERSQAEASALKPHTTRLRALSARFKAWLGGLDIAELASQTQRIKDHEYMLLRYKMESQHLLSDEGEELAAALDETGGSSWAKLYTNLIARQTITAPVTTDSDQETGAPLAGEFVVAELRALQSSRDRDVRRRAFEAEVALLRRNDVPFAAAMNGIKGQVEALAQRRGWSGAFEYSLFQHGITRASLDAMQSACAERFDDLRGYLLTKARLLGTEKLAWYDLFAPLPQTETPSYTWPEAKAFVVERFATYSDRLATFAQRTFDEGWLDVPPRKGKRNGAFCSAIHPRGESRVMLNFTGNAGDIRTLAHELGHAYHNDCKVRSGRDVLQVPTPMTLAETASIFCETIVFQDQLQASSGPIRLALLEQDLQQVTQLVIDIHSRF